MKLIQIIIFAITYMQYLEGKFTYNEEMITKLKSTKIYVNGKFKSIETIMENNSINNNLDLFNQNNGNDLLTALKCEYAKSIIGNLESFHKIYLNELLASDGNLVEPNMGDLWNTFSSSSLTKDESKLDKIIEIKKSFTDIKPYITQILYNLFRILNMDQKRKTNDLTFSKSILAIYLFYNYHSDDQSYIVYDEGHSLDNKSENNMLLSSLHINYEKTMKNIVILNNSIIYMISLINIFRLRNCEIQNPSENIQRIQDLLENKQEYKDVNKEILRPYYSSLDDILDFSNLSYSNDKYDDWMYKPETLMMKSLLDDNNLIIGTTKIVKNNEPVTLLKLYENIKESYSIDEIFNFQTLLLNLINDMFYRRIHKLISENEMAYLRGTQVSFNTYTKIIIPKVCLKDACKNVLEMKLLLDDALDQYSKTNDMKVFKTMLVSYESKFNSTFIYPDSDKQDSDPTLESLIQKIRNVEYFNAFSQVIKLLSYESYDNIDYQVIKISDHEKKDDGLDQKKKNFLENMNELRYALYAFSIFSQNNKEQLDNVTRNTSIDIPEKFKTNTFGTIFAYALIYIVKTYNDLSDRKEFKNVLLPLLIQFQNINQVYPKMEEFDFQSLYQTVLVAINMIENKLLLEYKWVPYNNFIYTYRVLKNKNKPDLAELYNYLQEKALKSLSDKSYEKSILQLYNEYMVYVHKSVFNKNDNSIRFYWNGALHSGYEISEYISQGVIYLNDLIRYQTIVIKSFVAKILLSIQCFLELSKDKQDIFVSKTESMQNKVKEFDILEFPPSVEYILADTVQAILKTISSEWNVSNVTEFKYAIQLISEDLKALDVNHMNHSCPPIDDIVDSLNNDLELCSKFLTHLKEAKVKNDIILQDLSLSLVENKITDEIDDNINDSDDMLI